MASQKPVPVRSAKSSIKPRQVRLSQIEVDGHYDYCHRADEALKDDRLELLADSLVREGQQVSLTVYDSGKQDDQGEPVYTLVGGFRRFHALRRAIKENIDPKRIHDAMLVNVDEMVRGAGQSDDDFHKDILVRSVSENEQRVSFTTDEKLEIVKRLHEAKVPAPRATSALNVSESQFRRFLAVVEEPWMHDHVRKNDIGLSHAAELMQKATSKDRVPQFRDHFGRWVDARLAEIEKVKQDLDKVNKKLTGPKAHAKGYLTRDLVQHWIKCMDEGRDFTDEVVSSFGILLDEEKGLLTIPAVETKVSELSASYLAGMIGELDAIVKRLLPFKKRRELLDTATGLTDDECAAELSRIRDARRKAEQERAEADAGEPAPDFHHVDDPEPEPVDVEDEEQAEATTDEPRGADEDAGGAE